MLKNQYFKFLAFLIFALFCYSLFYFSVNAEQPEEKSNEIIVKSGDTLAGLSQKYMNDMKKWPALAEYNNISDPKKLPVGITLKIPPADFTPTGKIETSMTQPSTHKRRDRGQKKLIEPPKISVEPKPQPILQEDPQKNLIRNIERDLLTFENEMRDLVERDSLVKNQKEYNQILKTLDDAKNELGYNNTALAGELLEKAKILYEKLKINVQVETIILKPIKVVQVKGKVDVYNDKEKMWIPSIANITRLLNNNDKIRTSDLSGVTLVAEDGSIIVVRPNTEIEINRNVYDVRNNTLYSKIKLLRGNIIYTTRQDAPVKTVNEIETLEALIDFEGQLSTTLTAEGTVKYELYRGKANILTKNEKVSMPSGTGVYVFPRQKPSQPVKLLESVNLSSPLNNIFSSSSNPELIWQPVKNAEMYLVQIAEDEAFYRLVFEQTVRGLRIRPSALLDGKYYWRVIPIDSNGFFGYTDELRNFMIDTIAPRLVLITPIDDQIINEKFVKFQGFTEPGRVVTINQYTIIPSAKGEFSYSVPLKQGTNIVRLMVSDEAGNTTKIYRMIHADYELQLKYLDNKAYSTIDRWWLNTYDINGQIIFNNDVYQVNVMEWSREIKFDAGSNLMSLGLNFYPFKEINFIYDNDKPILKSLRITPELRGDFAQLVINLIAIDATSALDKNAKITLLEKDDPAKRYNIDLVFNTRTEEYYGRIEVQRALLKKELILAQIEVSDIAGNKTVLSEETLGLTGKPSHFWDKVKTNYKQLGLPLFILSGGGIFFSL
ncbi:MAG TPA: LysM peptidoglycan-binding domain-containing protein [bacterium]|nr:LysM peptidoglycan-binding domain-containing protein [bacterium]